jgi:hypothetical protein
MKQLFTIALLFIILSCGQNDESNRNEILTSSIWTIEKESIDGFPRMTDKYEFLADGSCLLVAGETEIHGKWNWAGDDEIYIRPEGTVVKGRKIKIDGTNGLNIKVVELNDKTFRTIEKMEVDSWSSGLLKERKYAGSSL